MIRSSFKNKSCMFVDNKSSVDSIMTPHGKIHKIYVAFYFNRGREAIASGIISYCFIGGSLITARMLSKH